MLSKSTILHLRIPFSFFLMPFFIFAFAQSVNPNVLHFVLTFLIIHLFFYPASNGYNSYFDKDEESIGGLENPPPVDKQLLYVSLGMDTFSLLLALLVNPVFAGMLFIIQLVSRAYSHPSVRLKKYPITGLLTVALFQGAWIYMMSTIGLNGFSIQELFTFNNLFSAGMCSLMLLGSYPMTQVYQHGEDGRRGDQTISRMLGIKGTFFWTLSIFSLITALFVWYFMTRYGTFVAMAFPLFLSPTLIYFSLWLLRVLKDEKQADFKSTMRLNMISSLCFVAFFVFLYLVQRIE